MFSNIFDDIQIPKKEVKNIINLTFPTFKKRKVTIVISQNDSIDVEILCIYKDIKLLEFNNGQWYIVETDINKKFISLEKNQVIISKGENFKNESFIRIVTMENSILFTHLNFNCTDYSIHRIINGELTFIKNKATKYN